MSKEASTAKCDHKFIDSNHCLKCGWSPNETKNAVLGSPAARGSAAGAEAALGITKEVMRELIKPLVLLMHRNRLPFVTIKLNNGIATVSTVKPPNARTQPPPG